MRLPPSLREPSYRRYVGANVFALQGMWAQRTVVAWLAWELTGASSWVGVIAFLSFAPTLVSGPIFGVLADRSDLRRAAIIVQMAIVAVGITLFATLIAGFLTIEALAVIALTQGVAISAHHPVRLALTPRLAPRGCLANAIAISSINFNLARLAGPAAAGVGISEIGAGATVAITIALYAPVIVVLTRLTARPAEGAPPRKTGVLSALTDGARFAWGSAPIRRAMALTVLFSAVVRGYLELLSVVADGAFQRGAAGFGELMAAAGAGALSASLVLATMDLVTGPKVPKITYVALYVGLIAAAASAAAPAWGWALSLTCLAGFCSTIVGVTMQSVVQLVVDDAHRGRVLSLWIMVGVGFTVVGALVMGVLIDVVGLRAAVGAAAGIGLISISAMLLFAASGDRRAFEADPQSRTDL